MPLLIAADALPALAAATPKLLVLPGVRNWETLRLHGLSLWLAQADEAGALRLVPDDAATTDAPLLPAPAMTPAMLAVLTPRSTDATALLRHWAPASVPAVIKAASAAAALPQVTTLLLQHWQSGLVALAGAQQALAALREQLEQAREAHAGLLQGGLALPQAPLLLGPDLAPGDAPLRLHPGRSRLAQRLNISADGLAAIGIHLAAARVAPATRVEIRLLAAESGRVLGRWTLPGDTLQPGWLLLDLPTAIGPCGESACLDLLAELEEGDDLAVSLEAAQAWPGLAVQAADAPDHALATRIWTAAHGRRFTVPPFWDWAAQDLLLPPPGMPQAMPLGCWQQARLLGSGGILTTPPESGVPQRLELAPGAEAGLLLPGLPLAGFDTLQARLRLHSGDGAGMRAALWLLPQAGADALDGLPHHGGDGRGSGWHGFDGHGLAITLPVPPGAGTMAAVMVVRNDGDGPVVADWQELAGRALPVPSPLPAPATPGFALVEDVGTFSTPDGSYRNIAFTVRDLRHGHQLWPEVRLKFALVAGAKPHLELRGGPQGHSGLEIWPGNEADRYGPFWMVWPHILPAHLAHLRTARDRMLLAALLQLLPRLVAATARRLNLPAAAVAEWTAATAAFAPPPEAA